MPVMRHRGDDRHTALRRVNGITVSEGDGRRERAELPYLYRVMPQGGSAWALRPGELFCVGMVESAPCPR